MYKIIGADRREYGPIPVDQLKHWIAEGRLNRESLARPEGGTQWQPLGSYPDFQDVFGAPTAAVPPLPTAPANAEQLGDQILSGDPQVDIGDCLRAGFSFLAGNAGLAIGGVTLIWIVTQAVSIVTCGLGHLVLWGPLFGGLFFAVLRSMRGETVPVGEVFSGFKRDFVQLMLAGAVFEVLVGFASILVLPGIYLGVAWAFAVPLVADKRFEFWSAMELSRKVVTRVWFQMAVLLVVSFLPYAVAQSYVGISMLRVMWKVIQTAMSGGTPDISGSFSLTVLGFVPKLVLLLNLFYGVGVLMRAYENLFSARAQRTA